MKRIQFMLGLWVILAAHIVLADIPAAYVDIGYGAHPSALGGAYTARANDAHAVLWNPAGLLRRSGTSATFMYTRQLNLIPSFFGAAGIRLGKSQAIGVAAIASGDDVYHESTLMIAYAHRFMGSQFLRRLLFGVNTKLRYSSFGNNDQNEFSGTSVSGDAWGVGIDVGLQYVASRRFVLGIMARDIVSPIQYSNETTGKTYSENVPPAVIGGVSYRALKRVSLSMDYESFLGADNFDKIHGGFEYIPVKVLALRGGVIQRIDVDTEAEFTVGAGLNLLFGKRYRILADFAYIFHFLEDSPRMSVSFWF